MKIITVPLLKVCLFCFLPLGALNAAMLTITVPTQSARADLSLENLPLLIRLSPGKGGFSYSDCQPDGSDIVFTGSDGTVLPHEIDTWDTTGESLIWVRVPRFAAGESYTMHFGNHESVTQSTSPSSMDVWKDFACVLHCRETNGQLNDSSPNANAALVRGNAADSAANVEDGAIGNARQGGSRLSDTDIYHHIPGSTTLPTQKPFSISGWFRAESPSGYGRWVSTKSSWNDDSGWELTSLPEDERYLTLLGGGANQGKASVPSTVGTWTHFAISFSESGTSIYTNGFLSTTLSITAGDGATGGLSIGNNIVGTENRFNGQFDEFRYYKGELSPAVVETEFRMVAEKDFLTYAPVAPAVIKTQFAKSIYFSINLPDSESTASTIVVPIRLSSSISGFSYDDFMTDNGSDIAIFDKSDNLLAHEVDEWNPSGESIVWVRLPNLSNRTSFTLMYGSPTYRAPSGTATWAGYAGVWHFGEDSGAALDSTSNSLHAEAKGGETALARNRSTSGIVGMARNNGGFGGVVNDEDHRAWLSVPDSSALHLGKTFTVSGWFKTPGMDEELGRNLYATLISKRSEEGEGWGLIVLEADNRCMFHGVSAAA